MFLGQANIAALAVVCLLAPSLPQVYAIPGLFGHADKCQHEDKCVRALAPGCHPIKPAVIKADCSSFFSVTVTPAYKTTTKTVVSIRTEAPVTITAISHVESTRTVDDLLVATLTSEIVYEEVDTMTIGSTSFFTTNPVTTVYSIVATSTETVTVISSTPVERDTRAVDKPRAPIHLPATRIAERLPPYAAACEGAKHYSSACYFIGVHHRTTTLPALTETVHITKTVRSTPTVTLRATSVHHDTVTSVVHRTSTIDESIISVSTVTLDVETTIVSSIPSTVTLDFVEVSTMTVTSTPIPTSFIIQAEGGASDGQYLIGSNDESPTYFTSDPSSATVYSLASDTGYLTINDLGLIVNTNKEELFAIYPNTQSEIDAGVYVPFVCQISKTLELTCKAKNDRGFYTCPTEGPGPAALIGNGYEIFSDCEQFTAKVVAA